MKKRTKSEECQGYLVIVDQKTHANFYIVSYVNIASFFH
jgi:hypothetical protein